MQIKTLSLLLVSLNISANTLMEPTSKSEDLYDGVILDGTILVKLIDHQYI